MMSHLPRVEARLHSHRVASDDSTITYRHQVVRELHHLCLAAPSPTKNSLPKFLSTDSSFS
jgi:hypothetical protein